MSVFLLKMICPVILLISVFYPFYRGVKGVCWWKSILLGWTYFMLGCLFREYGTPAIAMVIGGIPLQNEMRCENSTLVLGVALGWILPLVFHGLGMAAEKGVSQLKVRRSEKRSNRIEDSL